MKTHLVFLLLFISISKAETIKIVGDENYLPIIGVNDGKKQGVLIERLDAIKKEAKLEFEYSLYPWARAYFLSQNENVGIVGISKNSERNLQYDFSDSIYTDSIILVVKSNSKFNFKSFEDLKSKRIGAQLNASHGEEFDKYSKDNHLKIETDLDQSSRLLKVLHDRIDVALIGNGTIGFKKIIESNPELKKRQKELMILSKPLTSDNLYLAFTKKQNKQNEINLVNSAIKKLNFK